MTKGIKGFQKGHPVYGGIETRFKKGRMPWNKGKSWPEEIKEKIRKTKTGQKHTKETRLKISKAFIGKNHPMWKGGITPENMKLISSKFWRKLRLKILKRDDYTCQKCSSNEDLVVDHIIPWRIGKNNSEKNLQVLCRGCNVKKGWRDGSN
ncbi:MAG: HNH endonuclease [Bacteroidetes bacterium]|nr:HNH endonuclease [Bacteroidota bacterium]